MTGTPGGRTSGAGRYLRRHLASNGFYCSVRDALADPDGEEGRALKEALDSGDYGTVVRGYSRTAIKDLARAYGMPMDT